MKKLVVIPILIILLMPILPVFKAIGASTILAVNPLNSYVTVNKTLSVDITVTDVVNLTSWQFTMYFNNSVLNCTDVTEGPFLKTGGGTFFGKTITNNYNSTHGSVQAYDTLLGNTAVNGNGILATITFNALIVGDSTLHLSDTKLGDEKIPPQPITHTINDGTAHVQAFTLTLSTTGSGSVVLNNTGPYYHYGEVIQLTANPVIGWSFNHWTGDLIGSANPASLTITGNMSVDATFTQDQYTLSITISGGGNVTKNPDQTTYTYGTNVTLTANANIGWTFASWSGDASGSINPTTVNMTGNKGVTVTFTQNTYTLTVNTAGQGTVNRNNSGPYHYGDVVQLTANASVGWAFDHWSLDLIGSANPATLTITGNMAVTAHFTQIEYTLSVSVDGSGSVNRNNSGPYHYGDVVQLAANASVGWTFDHWTGDLIGSANPATLTITGNMSVTAHFTQNVYTLTVNVVGQGSVNRNNTGPSYHYGDVIELTAVPTIGWAFDHWSLDLIGSANPATLTITRNMIVNATFTQQQYTLSINVVGGGSVSKNPNQTTYTYGTNVTLAATANIGWSFASWSGAVSGTASPVTVNMTGDKSVTATFTENTYTLIVNTIGSGSVNLNASGPYHYGDAVVLTSSASIGWIFHYWTGDLTGSTDPATLIMTGNFTVTAHFTQKPALQIIPANKTCRMYTENFNVTIIISNALNVEDFDFEVHFNTTLLDYVTVTWNAWGSGTINVNEAAGTITGHTSGTPINGTQTLVTIKFGATYRHVWKSASGWTNDLSDTIFLQKANTSYAAGPVLRYEKGGLNQIDVGPDFVYTFSPIQGDVNNDGTVELVDLRLVAIYFGVKQGDALWSEASTYDLDGNGIIDVFDLRIVAVNYLYHYEP